MAKKKPSYKEALNELEEIVIKLEDESTDIDDLSELTKRALDLVNYCREKLKSTEEDLKSADE
ncbi:MAG: exodeoxyribonuclease VII small subunit [Cyclobacteriaceae bacterium]